MNKYNKNPMTFIQWAGPLLGLYIMHWGILIWIAEPHKTTQHWILIGTIFIVGIIPLIISMKKLIKG